MRTQIDCFQCCEWAVRCCEELRKQQVFTQHFTPFWCVTLKYSHMQKWRFPRFELRQIISWECVRKNNAFQKSDYKMIVNIMHRMVKNLSRSWYTFILVFKSAGKCTLVVKTHKHWVKLIYSCRNGNLPTRKSDVRVRITSCISTIFLQHRMDEWYLWGTAVKLEHTNLPALPEGRESWSPPEQLVPLRASIPLKWEYFLPVLIEWMRQKRWQEYYTDKPTLDHRKVIALGVIN